MITLTPRAAVVILNSVKAAQAEDLGLRLAAREAEDGIQYGMGFDEKRDGDEEVNCEGVRVYIGPNSQNLLAGVVVDFVDFEGEESQFIFMHPEQTGGCSAGGCQGCGAKH